MLIRMMCALVNKNNLLHKNNVLTSQRDVSLSQSDVVLSRRDNADEHSVFGMFYMLTKIDVTEPPQKKLELAPSSQTI